RYGASALTRPLQTRRSGRGSGASCMGAASPPKSSARSLAASGGTNSRRFTTFRPSRRSPPAPGMPPVLPLLQRLLFNPAPAAAHFHHPGPRSPSSRRGFVVKFQILERNLRTQRGGQGIHDEEQ